MKFGIHWDSVHFHFDTKITQTGWTVVAIISTTRGLNYINWKSSFHVQVFGLNCNKHKLIIIN